MKGYITVRKVENINKKLIEYQSDYPHFTKVIIIYESGMFFCYDYINEAINDFKYAEHELICACSFIQKDLMTGRDIIVIFVKRDVQ